MSLNNTNDKASPKADRFDLPFSTIFSHALALVLLGMALTLLLFPLLENDTDHTTKNTGPVPETLPPLAPIKEPNDANSTSNHPSAEPSAALPSLKID